MPTAPRPPLLDRVLGWGKSHPLLVDCGWAIFWTFIGTTGYSTMGSLPGLAWVYFVLVLVAGVGIALRRTRTRLAIGIIAVAMVIHVLVIHELTAGATIATLGAAYMAHEWLGRAGRRWVTVAILVGTLWAIWDSARAFPVVFSWELAAVVVSAWLGVIVVCLLGALARKRREDVERSIELARAEEAERTRAAELAALDERTYIARELHDLVAHSLGVIIAQADGGRYAAPEAGPARDALETISRVGRESLSEMRALISVLRSDAPRDVAPAPSVSELDALIADYRNSGLDVRCQTFGSPPSLSSMVELTIYRTVQEGLANAMKHGADRTANLSIAWLPGQVHIELTNPMGYASEERLAAGGAHQGHGLVGMRERVEVHGGTFTAQVNGALWVVHVMIPIEEAA